MISDWIYMEQQKNKQDAKNISFIIFDLDGVLVDTISSWVYLHEHYGVNNDTAFYAYMNNEIDDYEFMRKDIELWLNIKKKLHIDEIQKILNTVPLMPGLKHTMKCLSHLGISTAIVSAGLEQLALRIATFVGIPHVFANGLEIDEMGYLTGEGILRVSLRNKGAVVEALISELDLDPSSIVSVGNGEIDIQMFNVTGLGIAFNPHDQIVIDHADIVIHKKDLTELLRFVCDIEQLPSCLKDPCFCFNQ